MSMLPDDGKTAATPGSVQRRTETRPLPDEAAPAAASGASAAEHAAGVPPPQSSGQPVRSPRKRAPAAAAEPADTRGKPFSMSYGGTTTADYVEYLLERGGR